MHSNSLDTPVTLPVFKIEFSTSDCHHPPDGMSINVALMLTIVEAKCRLECEIWKYMSQL